MPNRRREATSEAACERIKSDSLHRRKRTADRWTPHVLRSAKSPENADQDFLLEIDFTLSKMATYKSHSGIWSESIKDFGILGLKKTRTVSQMSDSFSRADKTRFSKRLKVKFNKLISAHARKYEPQSAAVAVKNFFMQHQRPFLIDWPSFAVAGESLAVMFAFTLRVTDIICNIQHLNV